MKINVKPPTNKYTQLRDLEPGQCAWIERNIGDGIFDVLIMKLGFRNGIDGYVSLETGFVPGLDQHFRNGCLDWKCIPANVKIVEDK